MDNRAGGHQVQIRTSRACAPTGCPGTFGRQVALPRSGTISGTLFSVRPQRITRSGRTTSTALPCNSPRRWRHQQSSRTTGMGKSRWLIRDASGVEEKKSKRVNRGRGKKRTRSCSTSPVCTASQAARRKNSKGSGKGKGKESRSSGSQRRSFTEMSDGTQLCWA